MLCKEPFQIVSGLGCLWLYTKQNSFHFDDALKGCQSNGGDLFETFDWDHQQKLLYDYFIANGSKSFSRHIHRVY